MPAVPKSGWRNWKDQDTAGRTLSSGISRFQYGDLNNKEYRRQIINIFPNSIYVFDDRLVFTYNYKNGTQIVTLADVPAAFGSDLNQDFIKTGMQYMLVFCLLRIGF